jgi:hypothetical protein
MGDLVAVQSATFSFTERDPHDGIGAVIPWRANAAGGFGSVDTVTVAGKYASGTATFVDETGESATEGSFEVRCVG